MIAIDPDILQAAFPKLAAFTGFTEQQRFYDSDARYTYAVGAVRTGKTYAAGHKFLTRIIEDYQKVFVNDIEESVTYWCVAPNYESGIAQKRILVQILPDHMIDWERQGDDSQWKNMKRGGGKICLIGNREIAFKSASDPEKFVSSKVRGVWWTEIARSKFMAWTTIQSRLANYEDHWLIADTSPFGRCWFYVDCWLKRNDPLHGHVEGFTWTAVDSPHVTQATIDQARASMPEENFKREFEASWATFEGQIYSSFDRGIHMVEGCPFTPEEYWISVDVNTIDTKPHSFSIHASGGSSRGHDGEIQKRLHKLSEHQHLFGLDYELYADTIAEEAKRLPMEPTIILDPSSHTQFKSMLSARGLTWYNGKNDILPGIRNLGGALQWKNRLDQKPLYTIDKNCKLTANEFEAYHWKRSAKGVVVEVPDKTSFDPHLLDGDRYLSHEIWSGYRAPRILN